ncbi:MarR family transcriptional regulator [Methanosphaera sp.]|uniref:MarR family winged helix-turn-helix transcriptional regulator n=1 Tax=Methanosphaera sp. TaxID=2666342 RepID=UPI0025FA59D7|nr:MarR family transcriptional regulator [Methanosphaera sp.]
MKTDDTMPTNAFISIINRKHASYINQKVKEEKLTYGLYPILITIYRNEGIIQEEIAQHFQLNESTVTRNLKKLEDKNLVQRTQHERKKSITLTEKGKQTARKVMDYDEKWDEKIQDILNNEEYLNFKNTLIKLCDELK